jgi:hypothetical protein
MDPSAVFSSQALRFLALAVLQTEDNGTIKPAEEDIEAAETIHLLHMLGLLSLGPMGWVASPLLLAQPWVGALRVDPFTGDPLALCD